MAWATDPDGTQVELTDERWAHILEEHAELADQYYDVLKAIGDPTQERAGRGLNERWYLVELSGGDGWMKVCVAYTPVRAFVTTAFRVKGPS